MVDGEQAARPQGLRPMEFGEILDHSFKVFRRQWKLLLLTGLLSTVPGIASQFVMNWLQSGFAGLGSGAVPDAVLVVQTLVTMATVLAPLVLLSALWYPLAYGALIVVAAKSVLGEPITLGQAFRTALRRYPALLGTSLLFGLLCIFALPAFILGGLVIFFFLTVPVGYAMMFVYLVFYGHAVVLEDEPGGLAPFGRSMALVKGRFWFLLGLGVVFSLMIGVLSGVIGMVLMLPVTIAGTLTQSVGLMLTGAALQSLTLAITQPFKMVGLTLAYYDTRVRKEGFDLQQMVDQQNTAPAEAP